MTTIYDDLVTFRIRVYLRHDELIGRIDGPPTMGENGSLVQLFRPDINGEFTLLGQYDLTGTFVPYFPSDLKGQEGIDDWFRSLEKEKFSISKVESV